MSAPTSNRTQKNSYHQKALQQIRNSLQPFATSESGSTTSSGVSSLSSSNNDTFTRQSSSSSPSSRQSPSHVGRGIEYRAQQYPFVPSQVPPAVQQLLRRPRIKDSSPSSNSSSSNSPTSQLAPIVTKKPTLIIKSTVVPKPVLQTAYSLPPPLPPKPNKRNPSTTNNNEDQQSSSPSSSQYSSQSGGQGRPAETTTPPISTLTMHQQQHQSPLLLPSQQQQQQQQQQQILSTSSNSVKSEVYSSPSSHSHHPNSQQGGGGAQPGAQQPIQHHLYQHNNQNHLILNNLCTSTGSSSSNNNNSNNNNNNISNNNNQHINYNNHVNPPTPPLSSSSTSSSPPIYPISNYNPHLTNHNHSHPHPAHQHHQHPPQLPPHNYSHHTPQQQQTHLLHQLQQQQQQQQQNYYPQPPTPSQSPQQMQIQLNPNPHQQQQAQPQQQTAAGLHNSQLGVNASSTKAFNSENNNISNGNHHHHHLNNHLKKTLEHNNNKNNNNNNNNNNNHDSDNNSSIVSSVTEHSSSNNNNSNNNSSNNNIKDNKEVKERDKDNNEMNEKVTTHESPIPERKKLSREKEEERFESKVRVYSPQAFKFFMEQHVENVIKSHQERVHRRLQLEAEMAKIGLSESAQTQMRKMLSQKESNYIRLKRAKMDKSMFKTIRTIGVGAFGEVALVRKLDTQHLYAMKTLRKSDVLRRNQVAHVKAERDILAEADNEWVVKLYYSFQDMDHLYFVMDYIPGGDLMSLLIKKGIFEESLAQFYIAELTCAVESVHLMGFIHRDIKPDNILIDRDGHIKLTDFGLCTGFRWTHNSKYYQDSNNCHCEQNCQWQTCVGDKPLLERRRKKEHIRCLAHSLVGTPNYIAPEVLMRTGYTEVADWWSVGVILYEMIIGSPPFYSATPHETQYKVINFQSTLRIPSQAQVSSQAKDLILKLCTDHTRRLGKNGPEQVKSHPFFVSIDFESGLRLKTAPYIPEIRHPTDTSNFDPCDGSDRAEEEGSPFSSNQFHGFYEFTFRRFFDDAAPNENDATHNEDNEAVYV